MFPPYIYLIFLHKLLLVILLKKFLMFILLLLPWGIAAILFPSDKAFYNSLNKPFFAPPSFIFGIVWPILYILITYTVYKIITNNLQNKQYSISLITNYITNQLFSFFFFTLKSPFLGFIDSVLVFITSIFLYFETKKLNDNLTKFLIPYLIWNLFAVILSLSIYFMNF